MTDAHPRPAWAAHLPAGVDPAAVDLLAGGGLPGAWTARWAVDGARRVLHDDAGGWVSAAELEARTRAVAGRLAAAGLAAGDRVLVSARPSVDLVVAYVAAVRLGLEVVPVNTAYREAEVHHVARDARPRLALVDEAERGRWVRVAVGDDVPVVGADVALPDGPDPVGLDAAGPGDPALLLYTSGTTGAPKGAPLTHGNLLASAAAVALAWRWTPEDRLVLALPLFHLHGLGVGLNGSLVAGASILVRPGFDAADVAAAAHDHAASLFFGVPTMYGRLAAGHLDGLARLRLCVSGSAPLSAELFEAVRAGSGHRIIERYGMTETVMNVSNPHDGERRSGTVGLPLPGVEVRLEPDTGEILLRGPNVFAGYLDRPDATAEAFTDDGWFRSGDLGALDDDGYLRIVGRAKDLIISGGYNVHPREVEDRLRAHPAVADAAVTGVPDDVWGEAVVAFVEVADGSAGWSASTERELRDLAEQDLAPYKRPKRYHRVDALPRNALGKVVKADLREP